MNIEHVKKFLSIILENLDRINIISKRLKFEIDDDDVYEIKTDRGFIIKPNKDLLDEYKINDDIIIKIGKIQNIDTNSYTEYFLSLNDKIVVGLHDESENFFKKIADFFYDEKNKEIKIFKEKYIKDFKNFLNENI